MSIIYSQWLSVSMSTHVTLVFIFFYFFNQFPVPKSRERKASLVPPFMSRRRWTGSRAAQPSRTAPPAPNGMKGSPCKLYLIVFINHLQV